MVLFSPAGGYTYRAAQQRRFRHHIGFVLEHGLKAVVDLARGSSAGFSKDPRVGPWAATLRSDDAFAAAYAATDLDRYLTIVSEPAVCSSTATPCPAWSRRTSACSRCQP
ncbi:hypothetical protein ACFQV4_29360 [Streptomyces thermocarboxydus]